MAFSDAVGHGLVDCLIELAEAKYTDAEFAAGAAKYKDNPPLTKGGLMYREIFNEMFPHQSRSCDLWLLVCQTVNGRIVIWMIHQPVIYLIMAQAVNNDNLIKLLFKGSFIIKMIKKILKL